ncbi:hypothetical protein PCANC_28555 [Puccinia coronata f. sp. avenae]|uniref:Inhibitor I9 domain-containing protein n=1 Tax=Puccinia coronata f. sp. avenae TaxID=200324 RepID=A0A2N5RW57_9BASI|nr:hypothetical protein PCANC_28555 [Puccinia coronata f. sp. avenae]
MKSYFLILFLVGTTLAASGLSDGLTRRKISSEIGEDFEHSIQDRSDDEGWQLVINRSNEGSCAGRSSSEWDSEHVTDSDREDALGDRMANAAIKKLPGTVVIYSTPHVSLAEVQDVDTNAHVARVQVE